MGYKKSEQGQDVVFEVTPEELPPMPVLMKVGVKVPIAKIIVYTFVALIATAIFSSIGWIGVLLGWVVTGVIVWWWIKSRRAPKKESLMTKGRVPSRFTVNPEGISVNGQFFKTKDIHRVVQRNEVLEAMDGQVVFGGSHMRNAGVQMGMAWNKQLAAVSYQVQFESGGVPHLLAGGLTEAGAFAITSDVGSILGRNKG